MAAFSRRRNFAYARYLVYLAIGAVAFVVLVCLLYFTSSHFQAATSDGASVVLEGRTIANGHVLLHGWVLTAASYWTSAAMFDAVGILLVGLRAGLLYATPAVAGALAIAAGILLARDARRGGPGVAGGVAVVALLALATPEMSYLFVGHGFHVVTGALALLAFVALRRSRFGWGWSVAVLLLTAGMLGDTLMVAFGIVPLLLAGLVAMLSERRLRSGVVEFTAAVASVLLFRVARLVFVALGAFRTGPSPSTAPFSQIVTNLGHVPAYVASLLGLTNAVVNSGGVPHTLRHANGFAAVYGTVAIGVLACFVHALVRLVAGLVQTRPKGRTDGGGSAAWRLDNVLVLAIVCSVVPFVMLAKRDGAGVRYLTVTAMFAVVLAGRMIARAWPEIQWRRARLCCALAGVVLVAGLAAGFGISMSGPAPPNTVRELDRLLSAHDLHQGIGGYWIASLATVESNGAVTVRPVLAAQDGGIKRQALLSSDAWYEGRKFQFVVFGAPAGYRGLRARTLPWGSPRYVHVVGPYRVLVWDHDLRVRAFGQPETAAAGRAHASAVHESVR